MPEKQPSRRKRDEETKPYSPRKMNMERIPVGCLFWILAIIGLAVYGVFRLFTRD